MQLLINAVPSIISLSQKVSRLSIIPLLVCSTSLSAYANNDIQHTEKNTIERTQLAAVINEVVDQTAQAYDITGATIAVQFEGEPLLTRTMGYADENTQRLVDENTGFRIGSISKLFAALAIMQLVDEGALSLDDSIFKHLPDYQPKVLPGVNPDNRIRDLLTHHNGIPSLWLKGFAAVDADQTPLEAMRELPTDLSQDYLVENRRRVHAYTNAAFALLGVIVENVSGMSYDDYLKTHFFDQYGMHDAYTYLPAKAENLALPHQGHQSFPSVPLQMVAAGSVIASANDMHIFSQLLLDTWHGEEKDFLRPKTLRQMSKFQHRGVKYDLGKFMGLGFIVDKSYGFKNIGHNGSLQTFNSAFEMIPSLNFSVFVSSNGAEAERFPDTLTDNILATIAALVNEDVSTDTIDTYPVQPEVSPSQQTLPYTGYFMMTEILLELIQDEDKAFLKLSDELRTLLNVDYELLRLTSIAPQQWQAKELPYITLKKVKRFQGYDLRFNNGSVGLAMTPLVCQLRDRVWDQRLNQTFSVTEVLSGQETRISASLQYDDVAHVYYFQVNVNGESQRIYVEIIDDNLLQTQGEGRDTGTVFEYTQDNTLVYSGLIFEREDHTSMLIEPVSKATLFNKLDVIEKGKASTQQGLELLD